MIGEHGPHHGFSCDDRVASSLGDGRQRTNAVFFLTCQTNGLTNARTGVTLLSYSPIGVKNDDLPDKWLVKCRASFVQAICQSCPSLHSYSSRLLNDEVS
jgi:hypothetical protein